MYFNKILTLTLFFYLFTSVSAQLTRQSDKLNSWGEKYEAGVPRFAAAALPVFDPDHDFAGAFTLNTKFKTRRNNDYLRYSNIPINVISNFTDKHSIFATFHSFWLDDLVLLHIDANLNNRIDNYWGVGQKSADNIEKGESTTQYQNNSYYFSADLNFKVVPNHYLGLTTSTNKLKATELAEVLPEDPYILEHGTDISNTGLGIAYYYEPDGDNLTNKNNIFYIKVKGIGFLKDLGSDFEYQRIEVNYNHSLKLESISGILRWQLQSLNGFGDVPWTDMAFLGGRDAIKGLPTGKYRDKSATHAFVEFLYLLQGYHPTLENRHAIGLLFGGGAVYGYENMQEIILNTNLSYSFLYQPNTDLRIDLGFSDSSFGMHLGFNQRF